MNILIVAPSFGTYGGIEAFVCALASSLRSIPGANITLCFKIVRGFRLSSLLAENANQACNRVIYAQRASWQLLSLIYCADIVHCQNPCIDVAILARLLCKPLALTIHNFRQNRFGLWELSRTIAFLIANRRWYNSRFVWATWERTSPYSTSEKLPVVSRLPEGSVPMQDRKGFVFISRWIANKGLDVLVEAYAYANIDHDRWPLVLMGDGPLRSRIQAMITELSIKGVQVLGSVSDQTRDFHIKHARWMVTPPHTNEDMGLTPYEARNVGVPCIVTRDGGLPEAAGHYALICEPADINDLRDKLEVAASMSDRQYEYFSTQTFNELRNTLMPLSIYYTRYSQMLRIHIP